MLTLLFLTLGLAGARESVRPTSPQHLLIGTRRDVGWRVRGARVVAFNRRRLTEIFPRLEGQGNAAIEAWILRHAAYVNTRQLALTDIRNTAIDFDRHDAIPFYIAPGMGRGADIAVEDRIINLKGTGNSAWNEVQTAEQVRWAWLGLVDRVRALDHASGLETSVKGGAEYLRHLVLQAGYDRIAARGDPSRETVEALFLIDNGYEIIASDQTIPSFTLGREAHFGRVVEYGLGPEPISYFDHGLHQASYSGARVDFGGATTPGEARVSYEDRLLPLGAWQRGDYIRREAARLAAVNAPRRAERRPRARREILMGAESRRARAVDPRALGLPSFSDALDFTGDSRAMAEMKARLFQMPPAHLEKWLAALGDHVLITLFESALGPLRIPLPEAAYDHGLGRAPAVREAAARATFRVRDRFPILNEALLALARAALARPHAAPEFVREMLTFDEVTDGLASFVVDAAKSAHPVFAPLALVRVERALHFQHQNRPRINVLSTRPWPGCEGNLFEP